MKLQFGFAEKKDLPAIVAMLADDPLGKNRERTDQNSTKNYENAFDKIASDPHQELTIVKSENEVIGVFQLSFIQYLTYGGGIRAQLEGVRVHEKYRGLGIGKKMVDYAIDRAKKRNAHLLQLTTDKLRPDAIQFYRSLGFKDSHEGMKLHF